MSSQRWVEKILFLQLGVIGLLLICLASAAKRWLEARRIELLPVDYYHVAFTLPESISALTYTNKAVIYRLLFKVAAGTLRTIAAAPKHLEARISATLGRCTNESKIYLFTTPPYLFKEFFAYGLSSQIRDKTAACSQRYRGG